LALIMALLAGMPAASASECPGTSVSFEYFQLLNDDYRHTAGPFAIELPSGVYDVTMVSWDAHHTHDQRTQLNEQWYFTTDSGYSSGLTLDIPLESNSTTTVQAEQTIDATTSITLRHAGIDNVNSVTPICIGFVPVEQPAAVVEETVAVEDAEVTQEEPAVEEPAVDTEVRGVVEEAPETGLVPTAGLEKKPVAQTAPVVAVLAITGPSQAATFTMVSAMLILFGAALLHLSRRNATA